MKSIECKAAMTGAALGLALAALAAGDAQGSMPLVPAGSVWKYLDDGSNPATAWRDAGFNDATWRSGPAQLGYGDGGEATVVGYGPVASNKFITTYFRRTFTVSNAAMCSGLTLRVLRDDGAAVYLNGVEVYRANLPAGALASSTLALTAVGGAAESTFYSTNVAAGLLVNGANCLAVEVHQNKADSSDLSFDLELLAHLPPIQLTVNGPAEGASLAAASAMLDVSVNDPAGQNVALTFLGRPAGPPPGQDFTLVALPDTQNYVSGINGGQPATFVAQTEWILANRVARNIRFVTQLGDCVQNGDNGGNDIEWLHATNAMYRLENPINRFQLHGIPYGIAVGNHDQSPFGAAAGSSVFYNQYFGVAHFTGRRYYGGHFGTDNDNHYQLFSASGLDFIIVHLEYDMAPDTDVLDWADQLLKTHADRRAILVSHYIIDAGFQATWSPQGQAIYEALKDNPNLFLMLCGHVAPEEGQRVDTYNGNTVYTLMSDYQVRANGGNGWLRLLEFSPSNNVLRVKTYSPTLNQFETDADSQFELPCDLRRGPAFQPIATATIAGSARTTFDWTQLERGKSYEWCAVATDGVRTTASPVCRFDAPFPPIEGLHLTSIRPVAQGVTLTWSSVPGRLYRVCFKHAVSDLEWQDLTADISASGTSTDCTVPAPGSHGFYAVREVEP